MINEQHRVVARLPTLELEDWNYELRGQMMWTAFKPFWKQLRFAGSTEDEVEKTVMAGKLTVLFDDSARALQSDHLRLRPALAGRRGTQGL
jgi:hypothetical protein